MEKTVDGTYICMLVAVVLNGLAICYSHITVGVGYLCYYTSPR